MEYFIVYLFGLVSGVLSTIIWAVLYGDSKKNDRM